MDFANLGDPLRENSIFVTAAGPSRAQEAITLLSKTIGKRPFYVMATLLVMAETAITVAG